MPRLTNWAGNVTFTAAVLHRPRAVAELQHLVAASRNIRALGTGHSFSTLADSPGDLVTVAGLPADIDIDEDLDSPVGARRPTVSAGGGLRYGELAAAVNARGYALRNLASLPHISLAGACATGTHGSGVGNGNLSTAVVAIELIGPQGDRVNLSRTRDPERFAGAVVNLGALGIVTRLTLALVPTYDVRQYVYDDLPGHELRSRAGEILSSGYSVSLFTTWQRDEIEQVWRKLAFPRAGDPLASDPVPAPGELWHGARPAASARHPLRTPPATFCTAQLGEAGPWHTRLPHFRMEFTPSYGDELQTEYLLPLTHAVEAFDAVAGLRQILAPVLLVSEIRTTDADDLWLSPSYARPTVALHFTWVKDEEAVRPVLGALEEVLAPFQARPHWGKLFAMAPSAVAATYPRLGDFARLRRQMDPDGKFGGALVDRYAPSSP